MFDALGVTTTCFLVPFSTSEGDLFTCFVMIFQSEGKVISGEGVRFKSIKKACHKHATDSQTNTLCF